MDESLNLFLKLFLFFSHQHALNFFLHLPYSISSKKTESEGGFSAAKKDSKRKREPSDGDDVEVKSSPSSPPEEEDDDGIQVRTLYLYE